jgi:nitrite reductase/ring-hydroxylating ferredoxin subunit
MSVTNAMTYLCDLAELGEATPHRIKPEGHDAIAVCRVGDAVFAVADTCSHGMASLSEGDVEGVIIYCPFHGGAFDLRSGAAVEKPCTIPIRRYDVAVENGAVFGRITP